LTNSKIHGLKTYLTLFIFSLLKFIALKRLIRLYTIKVNIIVANKLVDILLKPRFIFPSFRQQTTEIKSGGYGTFLINSLLNSMILTMEIYLYLRPITNKLTFVSYFILLLGPSPCTSNKSSVPPKFTFVSLFNVVWEWLRTGENGTDAVNEIYCVNLARCTPKTWIPSPSSIHSFIPASSVHCSGPSRPSALHSASFSLSFSVVLQPFILCSVVPHIFARGGPGGLYPHFFIHAVLFILSQYWLLLWLKVHSLKEVLLSKY